MTQLFLAVELVLKAIGLWDEFSKYIVQKKMDEMSVQIQDLNKALDQAKDADTTEKIYDAQKRVSTDTH